MLLIHLQTIKHPYWIDSTVWDTCSNPSKHCFGTQQPVDLGAAPLIAAGRENSERHQLWNNYQSPFRQWRCKPSIYPSITTMDNKEAKIVVGQNVPFRTGSTVTGSEGLEPIHNNTKRGRWLDIRGYSPCARWKSSKTRSSSSCFGSDPASLMQ